MGKEMMVVVEWIMQVGVIFRQRLGPFRALQGYLQEYTGVHNLQDCECSVQKYKVSPN